VALPRRVLDALDAPALAGALDLEAVDAALQVGCAASTMAITMPQASTMPQREGTGHVTLSPPSVVCSSQCSKCSWQSCQPRQAAPLCALL
jgi:hypothetical protein